LERVSTGELRLLLLLLLVCSPVLMSAIRTVAAAKYCGHERGDNFFGGCDELCPHTS